VDELTGTPLQIEWARLIIPQVEAEFDRVSLAFNDVAAKQTGSRQADTFAVLALLDEHRAAVLAHRHSGYFIREWQELSDQVRQLIFRDPRYQSIKANRSLS
jgi:hypothetical protein